MLAGKSENENRENKEGDTKIWNTSAYAAKNLKETAKRVKILEENVIKRGDSAIRQALSSFKKGMDD
jgi:hypothetical protein